MLPALIGMLARGAASEGLAGLFGATAGRSAAGGAASSVAARTQYTYQPGQWNGPLANPNQAYTPATVKKNMLPPELPSEIQKTSGLFEKMTDKLKGLSVGIAIPIKSLPELTETFVGSLTTFVRGIEEAAKPIESLVRVANPAQADAFARAIRDAYGVIGRSLIPVMQSFTVVARKMGDVMAGLEPVVAPTMKNIAGLVERAGAALADTIVKSADLFKLVAYSIDLVIIQTRLWIPLLQEQARIMNTGYKYGSVAGIWTDIGEKTGVLEKRKFDPNASGVGAAARQAQFIQPKELSNELIKNALMMGVGGQKTEKKAINDIDKNIGDIAKWLFKYGTVLGSAGNTLPGIASGGWLTRWAIVQGKD